MPCDVDAATAVVRRQGSSAEPATRLVVGPPPASDEDADARIRTFLVADEGALPVVLYQIPVVSRATETVDAAPDHIIGSPEPGTTFIDGPFDPAYARALIRLVTRGGEGRGPRTVANGHPTRHVPPDEPRTASVMTGEQSNTSLIYRSTGMPIICKVYRQLHPGLNPDIELPRALADAGSPHVPRSIGWVDGEWPDLATAQGTETGSLAAAQEFLPDVDDAWRVALKAAARADDFRREARALGMATADVHVALAELFPTRVCSDADRADTAATWQRRLAIAIAEVPAIADRRGAIEAVYAHALEIEWPALQRIHGDYHLGQVIQTPEERMGAAGLRRRTAAPDGGAHAAPTSPSETWRACSGRSTTCRVRSASMTPSDLPRRSVSGRATRDTRSSTATRSAPARISTPSDRSSPRSSSTRRSTRRSTSPGTARRGCRSRCARSRVSCERPARVG